MVAAVGDATIEFENEKKRQRGQATEASRGMQKRQESLQLDEVIQPVQIEEC